MGHSAKSLIQRNAWKRKGKKCPEVVGVSVQSGAGWQLVMFLAQWWQNVRTWRAALHRQQDRSGCAWGGSFFSHLQSGRLFHLMGGTRGKKKGVLSVSVITSPACRAILLWFTPPYSHASRRQKIQRVLTGRTHSRSWAIRQWEDFSFFFLKRGSASINPLPPLGVIQ